MGRVQGKVALITGAAKGIGRETALLLAREGARVAVTDVDEMEGGKVAEAIIAAGGEALFLKQDVADEAQWQAVVAAVVARFGALNILVNNAGVALSGSVEETSLEDWRWLMSINLDAVFLGTKHAILAMKETGGGSIVNLSSIEGIIGDPNLAAYNASKGGVRIFTKSAALHCAKAGYKIRVNSVHPGYIWTPMVEGFLNDTEDPAAGKEGLVALHPIGHLGVAADIANGILYLASDESGFMTGSELVIDGGYTAQ
ncbi:glucose 1-dehydrogenase [Zavarzinia sp.]|uniref:glucose 1-dehydrogenase n=1 Tax=Zavarzinia sp. TaxID=2027920 RepID=UPI003BB6158E|nr:glucose 1-dehydrogenase [Zavarzinia sp.]